MERYKRFESLNMMMIPRNERALYHNEDVFISDNIDDGNEFANIAERSEFIPLIYSSYPFKINFSIAILCLDGSLDISLNISEYKLSKNSLIVIPAETIGVCKNISDNCRLAAIAFSTDYFNYNINSHITLINNRLLSKSPVISLSKDEIEIFLGIYSNIRNVIEYDDDFYKKEMICNYLQIFNYNYCRLMTKYGNFESREKKNHKSRIFDQFMQLLEEFHNRERKIGFYADKLCLTPKYLSQIIFEVSSRYAGDWIKDYVILEAKALLKNGNYNVQQVSDMLNFPNQSFFGVYFKKAVGCSPLSYQNRG